MEIKDKNEVSKTKPVRSTATAEDQQQINRFARLHKHFLETKEKLVALNNELQNLGDAADEVLLLDDDATSSIPMLVGSVFVHYDQDTIGEKLESQKGQTLRQIDSLREHISCIEAEMKELRSILYAKFGDNIHLEDDEQDKEIGLTVK